MLYLNQCHKEVRYKGTESLGCFVQGVKKWHGMFCPGMFCPTFKGTALYMYKILNIMVDLCFRYIDNVRLSETGVIKNSENVPDIERNLPVEEIRWWPQEKYRKYVCNSERVCNLSCIWLPGILGQIFFVS